MNATKQNDFAHRGSRHTIKLFAATLSWVISLLIVDKGVAYDWFSSNTTLIAGVVINALLGLLVIWVYLRMLQDLDELQRKIQLEALAWGMGAGFVGGFTYSLMTTAGFITDPEVTDLILIMNFGFMAGVVTGWVRHR